MISNTRAAAGPKPGTGAPGGKISLVTGNKLSSDDLLVMEGRVSLATGDNVLLEVGDEISLVAGGLILLTALLTAENGVAVTVGEVSLGGKKSL